MMKTADKAHQSPSLGEVGGGCRVVKGVRNALSTAYNTVFRAVRRYDITPLDHDPVTEKSIYGVYHVFCDKGWRELVADQIGCLKRSGLWEKTSRLYVSCIVTDRQEADELLRLVGEDKAELVSVETDPMKFEYPALEFIRAKSHEEDCLLYYFHTKGVSYYGGDCKDRNYLRFRRNVLAWRHMMEYFIFTKWRVAFNVLQDGYDTYGCYRLPPYPKPCYLYAGNFWWVRSDYVLRLPPFPKNKIATNRFIAEEWLYKAGPRDFSAFDPLADLYYVYMDEALYTSDRLPVLKWMRYVWRFNWVKMCKHLFKYDYKAKRQKRYQVLHK